MTSERLTELREHLGRIADVKSAIGLLHWDQETYMPPKAAEGRGRQLATLSALAHRLATDPEFGRLLGGLANERTALSAADAKLVEVALYDYERETKLPESFIQEFALEQSAAFEVWVKARQDADFGMFRPNLRKLLDLVRRKADLFGYEDSPYDALLEEYERGMTTVQLKEIFGDLAVRQSELVDRITRSPRQPDVAWSEGEWPEDAQWRFILRVLGDMGYDFEAGRQDRSVHPFSTSFGLSDVRITTRLRPDNLFMGLMGSVHEGGHALYSQGHDPADQRTPLLDGASLGIHESQSRLWENMIGRSRSFWAHYTPLLREQFPGTLDGVSPEQVYRAVNRVAPSLIRTEADECTYNLHVIVRFEIEVGLIEGALDVDDVPEQWNAKMKEYLGVDVPNHAEGCLQDIHWSHGAFGYFPTYALGNLYAAQMFERILIDMPDVWHQVEEGDFAALREWLREHVHRHGRRKLAHGLVVDATGREPGSNSYVKYLEEKYGELYGA